MTDDDMRELARELFTDPPTDSTDAAPGRRRNYVAREGHSTPAVGFTPEMEQRDFVRELFDAYHVPARPPEPPEIPHHTDYA